MRDSIQTNPSGVIEIRFVEKMFFSTFLFATFLLVGTGLAMAQEVPAERFPGLVLGLRHQAIQESVEVPFKQPTESTGTTRLIQGNDDHGFTWYMVGDYDPANICNVYWAPPLGVVVGLRHTRNDGPKITMYGYEASGKSPHKICSLLTRMQGGSSGEDFFWYENRGHEYYDPTQVDMSVLPRGTVFCLRHTASQNSESLASCRLEDVEYSSIKADQNLLQARQSGDSQAIQEALKGVPTGFTLRRGAGPGDQGNDGFVWFEKVTGPEPWNP